MQPHIAAHATNTSETLDRTAGASHLAAVVCKQRAYRDDDGEVLRSVAVEADGLRDKLRAVGAGRAEGRVVSVTGLSVRVALPGARLGDVITIRRRQGSLLAEIVAVDEGHAVALPLGETRGLGASDPIERAAGPLEIRVGDALLSRVVDGLGRPLDGGPEIDGVAVAVDQAAPSPLERHLVTTPLETGIRAIDGFLTLGVGQRIGLFSGSGVGKSSLLGALARSTSADVVVVGLVGERAREVREFVENTLAGARARTVTVVATSDAPAIVRVRAAHVATRVAEWFRDQGRRVLLLLDSVTRVARAQREVGLAAGEPPARRGFPPSVFAMLPRLLERAGPGTQGSITAVYTVLVEADDLDEPVTDEVRGILDGHIVLSRRLASQGHYPAIDVPASVSRLHSLVASEEHRAAAAAVRRQLSLHDDKRDLVSLGAYKKGSDESLDRALAALPAIERFLKQGAGEVSGFEETVAWLTKLGT